MSVQSNREPTIDTTVEHDQINGRDKTTIKTQSGDVAVVVIAEPDATSEAVQEATSQAGIQHLLNRSQDGDSE